MSKTRGNLTPGFIVHIFIAFYKNMTHTIRLVGW